MYAYKDTQMGSILNVYLIDRGRDHKDTSKSPFRQISRVLNPTKSTYRASINTQRLFLFALFPLFSLSSISRSLATNYLGPATHSSPVFTVCFDRSLGNLTSSLVLFFIFVFWSDFSYLGFQFCLGFTLFHSLLAISLRTWVSTCC